METFIAFFDILGFKELVRKNEMSFLRNLMDNLLRDSQSAISGNKFVQTSSSTAVPDLEDIGINCLHISDSIVFWTNKTDKEDFDKMINVCHLFYSRSLQLGPLLRGCLTFGEIEFSPFNINNKAKDSSFINSSLCGKGLVDAYVKADSLEFAGCVIEKQFFDKSKAIFDNPNFIDELIYDQKICYYKTPSKSGDNYEYVFTTIPPTYNEVYFKNRAKNIEGHFTHHGIIELSSSVKNKLNNTIDFISHFRRNEKNLRTSLEE